MADLTTTITESVTLNGSLRGSTNSITTTGIVDVFERILTCTHSQTSHILFQAEEILIGEEDASPAFPTLEDLVTVEVRPSATTDVQVEVFAGLV